MKFFLNFCVLVKQGFDLALICKLVILQICGERLNFLTKIVAGLFDLFVFEGFSFQFGVEFLDILSEELVSSEKFPFEFEDKEACDFDLEEIISDENNDVIFRNELLF